MRVIRVKTGWMSAEATVAPPAGQRRPVEIVVGTGDPGIVVLAWRAYPVTEGPTGHVDAAAAIMPTGSNRPRAAVSLAEGDLVGYPRGPIAATVDADRPPLRGLDRAGATGRVRADGDRRRTRRACSGRRRRWTRRARSGR